MADSDASSGCQPEENDDPLLDAELRSLELRLRDLRPTPLRASFLRRVATRLAAVQGRGDGFRRGSMDRERDRNFSRVDHPTLFAAERRRQRWTRLVPLGIAALVVFSGIGLLHRLANLPALHPAATSPEAFAYGAAAGLAGSDSSVGNASAIPASHDFFPISAESSLREVEEEEIVNVAGLGPMRPVLLHYEAAQCWIDPETNTSVQVIQPWQELVFYPVSTY